MLKYLILVVQNTLTLAVLLSMLASLSRISGEAKQKQGLRAGFIFGTAFALLLAILKSQTVLINREYWNIGILSVAIVSEIFYCVSIWGGLGKIKPAARGNISRAIYFVLTAALVVFVLPDIFLYPGQFLLADESLFSTDFLFKLIGYLAGLSLVFVSGAALSNTGSALPQKIVRGILTIALAVTIVSQVSTILQFLLARRVIPMSKGLFGFIKTTINYSDFFLYAIMAVTALLPVLAWLRSRHPEDNSTNPAGRRKILALAIRQRRWCAVLLAGYVLSIFCLTGVKAYDEREVVLSPAEPMNIVGDEIGIPLESVSDGHLHRFVYTAQDGVEVRFIIIKKNANTDAYGVGLDACDICGPTGYYERGNNEVVCKLCDVVMNTNTIGFKGGCNPVPLAYTMSGGNMVIQTQSLEDESRRFA
ncbi:MAG: Fe-S-containing protein [Clostridiales Family XIII bacterium]|jgi:uncharacterized membrane protein|nr:Fe-S-containing protein [Clostridiales Family XIII bacterium]